MHYSKGDGRLVSNTRVFAQSPTEKHYLDKLGKARVIQISDALYLKEWSIYKAWFNQKLAEESKTKKDKETHEPSS